jgi:predicted nuclease of predicted toxin-antitoxin system
LQAASDEEIFIRAQQEQRVIVSADTDFGTLLATRQERSPSGVLFRHGIHRRPYRQSEILLSNLEAIETDLVTGALVVIEPSRIRLRKPRPHKPIWLVPLHLSSPPPPKDLIGYVKGPRDPLRSFWVYRELLAEASARRLL